MPKMPKATQKTAGEPMMITNPIVIMFEAPDGSLMCRIHPSETISSHEHYGLVICDLVRHVAKAFKKDENEVWLWVDKERRRPTSPVTQLS